MDELSTQTSASSCSLEKTTDPYNKHSCLSLLKSWVTWISQLRGQPAHLLVLIFIAKMMMVTLLAVAGGCCLLLFSAGDGT